MASGGARRWRGSIASGADLWLLDEPAVGLDSAIGGAAGERRSQLSPRRVAVLVIVATHGDIGLDAPQRLTAVTAPQRLAR